jgi:hypothetical protein
MMRRVLVSLLAGAILSSQAAARSLDLGPWWIPFLERNSEGADELSMTVGRIVSSLQNFPDHALFICSTSSTSRLGSHRRTTVIDALRRAGVPEGRIFDGEECKAADTGREGGAVVPEAVFLAMGSEDAVRTYAKSRGYTGESG